MFLSAYFKQVNIYSKKSIEAPDMLNVAYPKTKTQDPGPLRTQHPMGPRTLEDPGPLRTQDLWGASTYMGPRTLEDPGLLTAQDIRGSRTLEDLFCWERKCIIKQFFLCFRCSENILVLYEKLRVWYQECKRNKFTNRWFTLTRLKDCISFWYEMVTE